MGGDYVAVACDGCKIVSSYSDIEFRSAGMTDTPDPFRNGQLNLFHVFLECDDKDCQFLSGVFAPKPSRVTLADVRIELGDWTVSGVHCACGLTAVSPKAASLRQHELESSDNNLA